MNRLGTSLLALLAAAPLGAHAEVIDLEAIVVSSNLEATEADRSGASTEVLTQDDLKQTGDARAVDALSRVTGVSVRAYGPIGTQAGLTLRGVPQTNIDVFIDGIDVSDPSGTQVAFNFGGLSTLDVSRIEVVKGAQSALYGSNAIGGAINFTSRRATEIGTTQDAAIELGSYDTLRATYGLSTRTETTDLAFTLSRVQTDGFSAADENDGNTEADGYDASRLSFAGGVTFANGGRASLAGFAERSHSDYDERRGGVLADWTPDELETKLTHGVRAAYDITAGGIDHTLDLSFFDSARRLTGTNQYGDFLFDFKGERRTIGYRGATDAGANGRVVFGAESVTETYSDASVYGSQSFDTTTNAAYAEYALALTPDLDVTTNLRFDDHSRFGDFVTGRLSAVWRVRPDLLVRANLANGYRAPSNYELFDLYAGNPDLTPEKSTTYDLGIEKRFGDQGKVAVTLFEAKTRDMIDYSYSDWIYVQRDGIARRNGVEVSGQWTFGNGLKIEGGYTYSESHTTAQLDSSAWSADTPRHLVSLSLAKPITAQLSGIVTLQHGADRKTLPDYTVVNATLTYDFNDTAQAYARVENLLNEEYQLVEGYGTSDRALYVGLRKSF
jgi:vitamin B12 transporter